MERQINRSLSPTDEVIHRRHPSSTTTDENRASSELGDALYDDFPLFVPSPRHDRSPELETDGNDYQADWEEAEDGETYLRYAREFPTTADVLGDAKTIFENILEEQMEKNESPWAPFADKDEWELARWLAKNVNQRATEEFLKMSGVSFLNL